MLPCDNYLFYFVLTPVPFTLTPGMRYLNLTKAKDMNSFKTDKGYNLLNIIPTLRNIYQQSQYEWSFQNLPKPKEMAC